VDGRGLGLEVFLIVGSGVGRLVVGRNVGLDVGLGVFQITITLLVSNTTNG